VNALREGTWYYWDKDGKLLYKVSFTKGKKVAEENAGKPEPKK